MPPDRLAALLTGYDPPLAAELVHGFRHGFSLGGIDVSPGDAGINLPSCSMAPQAIDAYVASEKKAGRIAGPFCPPPSWIIRFSPIGLIPKKTPGSFRVIHHLSFPAGDSVNDAIPRDQTYVQYGSVDEALRIIGSFPDPYLAKTDIQSAFRIVPVRPADSAALGFRWRGRAYADLRLPMGCASSSRIFQSISDALVWIAQNKFGAGPIVSVLDDFLFIGGSQQECARSLDGFLAMCRDLAIPICEDKTVQPCQSLTFLGVILDVQRGELRLPADKLEQARASVAKLLSRRKAALRLVRECAGLLSFACVAVPLGRPFLRRIFDLCRGVSRPHHRVTITRESRLDMRAWLLFLEQFPGRSILSHRRWLLDPGLILETDASSSVGLGAICGDDWLLGTWPASLRGASICVLELVAVAVAVHVWRERFAHRCVLVRSDNSAVVACISSQSSRSPDMMPWLRFLFLTTVSHNILVRAVHTPGVVNEAADALSRGLIQVFKSLRPSAAAAPTPWDWPDCGTLLQFASSSGQR